MAIQQGTVTITGFVGADPTSFGKENAPAGCTFRLGCTRSYRNGDNREWKDMPTTWFTVKAFRQLASHARMSLHKGDPVIVTGLLNTEQWNTQSGETRSRMVIEASNIGHDLNYGVGELKRFRKSASDSQRAESASESTSESASIIAQNAGMQDSAQGITTEGRSDVTGANMPTDSRQLCAQEMPTEQRLEGEYEQNSTGEEEPPF